MAGFKFRLQSVLEYRQKLVDRLQIEAAAAQQQLAKEEGSLTELRLAEQRNLERLQGRGHGVMNVAETLQLTQHLDELLNRIAEQAAAVREAREEAEHRQRLLVEANAELKAMEKLRERQAGEHAEGVRRVEQIQTDEIAILQHRRLKVAL